MTRARTDFTPQSGAQLKGVHKDAIHGYFEEDVVEFLKAIDKARLEKGAVLLNSEIFEVMWNLGYRKGET